MEKVEHVNAEVTSGCNLSCDYCFNDSRKISSDELSLEDWCNVIDIAKSYGARSILLTGGEPMTRRDTPEIVRYAVGQGLETSILSNGYVLNDGNREMIESLHGVQISLDSADAGLHDSRRGEGSWENAMNAIRYVRSLEVPVEISSVISADRIGELEGISKVAYETGSRVSVRPMQSIGRASGIRFNDLSFAIAKEEKLLAKDFGDIFSVDAFGYVPVLGESHDESMRDRGIITLYPNGDIRGTDENILKLAA